MKLLHRDVIAVHEEVQQVHGQVSSRRTQPEPVTHNGYEVCKVAPEVQLWGLTFINRQPQLLQKRDTKVCCDHKQMQPTALRKQKLEEKDIDLVAKSMVYISSKLAFPPLALQLHWVRSDRMLFESDRELSECSLCRETYFQTRKQLVTKRSSANYCKRATTNSSNCKGHLPFNIHSVLTRNRGKKCSGLTH